MLTATEFRNLTQHLFSLKFSLCLVFGIAGVMAQTPTNSLSPDKLLIRHIDVLKQRITNAQHDHAEAAAIGDLWFQVASSYQTLGSAPQAEAAFNQALSLLNTRESQPLYADALEDLSSLYAETGRREAAENLYKKALVIVEILGDIERASRIHVDLSISLLEDGQGQEAEAEAKAALKMQPAEIPNRLNALVAHSYASSMLRRFPEAHDDIAKTMDIIVRNHLNDRSMEEASALRALGYLQWTSNTEDLGIHATEEALHILRENTSLPQTLVIKAELGVLHQYDSVLKAAHRKTDARQTETEIGRLEATLPTQPSAGTINVAALLPNPR